MQVGASKKEKWDIFSGLIWSDGREATTAAAVFTR